MIYRIGNNIVKMPNGAIAEKKVTSFSMTIDDIGFPYDPTGVNNRGFGLMARKPFKMTLNAGDEVFEFTAYNVASNGAYFLSISPSGDYINGFNNTRRENMYQSVTFQNQSSGTREVTIEIDIFEDIEILYMNLFNVYGAISGNIKFMRKLQRLELHDLNYITQFPEDLSLLTELRELRLTSISQTRLSKIPDSFFTLDLTTFQANGIFDLSDPISSNLFKINQFENLQELRLESSSINNYFPNDFAMFKDSIVGLRLTGNTFDIFPPVIDLYENLTTYYTGTIGKSDAVAPMFNSATKKKLDLLYISGYVEINIHQTWTELYSLSRISTMHQWYTAIDNFDEFVDNMYSLVTQNGSITQNSGQFVEYPNRFRNISWGHSSLSFTGAKVAPAGYVQGVSNGTPANQGEKVYVLQNQYGHTITHA